MNGIPVPREQLQAAITAERQRVTTLFAEIVASPRADIGAVKFAVEALRASQVRFAFVDEQIMRSSKPRKTEPLRSGRDSGL